jgi:CRP/FNR family cyclic AMP-dependent transcriptional regulator
MRRHLHSVEPLPDLSILANCSRRERARLAQFVEQLTLAAGTTIAVEGTRPHAVYIIRSGHVTLSHQGRLLGEIGPGDVFGEISAITGQPVAVTAVAGTDVDVVEIGQREFVAALDTMPALTRRVLRDLASGVRPLPTAA